MLPSAAMPWGRWLEESNEQTSQAVDRIKNDPNSPGNQFKIKAEQTATQIKGISVGTVSQVPLPAFVGVASGALGTRTAVVSSGYAFSSPTADSTSCLVILNFRITSSSGVAPLLPTMIVNGQQFSDVGANPQRPPTNNTEGYYSVMGHVPLNAGQTVNLQYGAVSANLGSPNTLTFDLTTVWLAFYGGL